MIHADTVWTCSFADTPGLAILLDPLTREMDARNVTFPRNYGLSTHLATCLMAPTSKGGIPLYVEYGGFPNDKKGNPKQPPTAAVSIMQLTMDGKPWSMQVLGDKGLPRRGAAAMTCGPDGVAYIFGGLEDKGGAKASKYAPTNTLYKLQISGSGSSYSLRAEELKPAGAGPAPRSQHVMLYLSPTDFKWVGKKGAVLIHGGSNMTDSEYVEERVNESGFSTWFKVFDDAWLYHIGTNRWERLSAKGAQPGLAWHAATINQLGSAGSEGGQVVLFGGITYANESNSFDREHALFLLDEREGGLEWRTVQVELGAKDANKVNYPNAAVAMMPGQELMLLRMGKVCGCSSFSCCMAVNGMSMAVLFLNVACV